MYKNGVILFKAAFIPMVLLFSFFIKKCFNFTDDFIYGLIFPTLLFIFYIAFIEGKNYEKKNDEMLEKKEEIKKTEVVEDGESNDRIEK